MRNSDPTAPFMAERRRIEQMFEPFKAEQRRVEYQALTDFGVPTRWSAAVPPPVAPAETPRVRLQPYVTPDVFLPPQRSSAQEIRSLRAEVEELRTLRAEDRAEIEELKAALEWLESEWFWAQLAPAHLDDMEPDGRPEP